MKISLGDLNVIVDTLLGTTSIHDGARLFKYTTDTRDRVAKKLIEAMAKVNLNVEVESE